MDWNAIEAIGTVSATLIAAVALVMTAQLQKQQQLLTQRQLVLPLWEYLSKLHDITPSAPIWTHVVDAVNTLELVAILYEGSIIDRAVIDRTFARQYLDMARKINQCMNPPPGGKSGPDMLAENRAALNLFHKFQQQDLQSGQLK